MRAVEGDPAAAARLTAGGRLPTPRRNPMPLSWLRRRPTRPSRPARFTPRVEGLDDRCLLTFVPGTSLITDHFPADAATGDFNGDGHRDLVVACQGDDVVDVFLGKGDGTFGIPKPFATGDQPVAVAVGDFNDDGKQDLATANQNAGTASVLFGNGDGTFFTKVILSTAGLNPSGIAAADLNGDGHADVAVTVTSSPNVKVFLYTGGPNTFGPVALYATGSIPSDVAVADFNLDGHPDLAVSDYGDDKVSV